MKRYIMEETRDLGGKLNINGKIHSIYGGLNTVGRNREAVVNIKSLSVSQHHAIFILVDDDLHFISDLKSSNGTFLDGVQMVALQLYRIKNGSKIKFADISGTYFKCTSEDSKLTSPNNSQYTQQYTQSFYGTDTQIMDDSCLTNNKTVRTQNTSYIPTQVLINVATALETSYEKLHEQPTQLVVKCQDTHEMPTQMVHFQKTHDIPTQLVTNKPHVSGDQDSESRQISDLVEESVCEVDQSIIDLHEAETQKVIIDDKKECKESLNGSENMSDYHEMKTQLVLLEENSVEKITIFNPPTKTSIQTNEIQKDLKGASENSDRNVSPSTSNVQEKHIHKFFLLNQPEKNPSQDSDQVKPLGISRNLFMSQNCVDENISDSDSDIIKPVKISVMAFDSSQETLVDDNVSGEQTLDEDSNDSVDFMTMQKVTNLEKKCIGEDNATLNKKSDKFNILAKEIEEKVTEFPKYANENREKEAHSESKKDEKSEASDSETDIENDFIERNAPQDGSETDNEKVIITEKSNIKKRTNQQSIDSSSDVHIVMKEYEGKSLEYNEKKHTTENSFPVLSDSDTDDERHSISSDRKKKMFLQRKKKKANVILDSESETDIDTDIEKENIDITLPNKIIMNTDNEKNKDGIIYSSKMLDSSNFDDSAFAGEEKLIDETKIVEGILDYSVETDVNLTNVQTNETRDNVNNKNLLGINEFLNDSDIIPATQECAPAKIMSQNSKLENSEESFKLGLTQLMEDDTEEVGATQQKLFSQNKHNLTKIDEISNKNDGIKSGKKEINDDITNGNQKPNHNSLEKPEEVRKKFIFKKKNPSDNYKQANITLDYDEEIYEAKTQNLCQYTGAISNNVNDGHVFLQPTQKLSKTKVNSQKILPEDEIYQLCTQKFDGSTNKNDNEDIYLQSTQKLTAENSNNGEGTNKIRIAGEDIYLQSTHKCQVTKTPENVQDDDDLDTMFATQTMIVKTTPKKCLESELEFMFATQRAVPTEESLDKIQDIVFQKPIDDTKLPEQDSDLEAILATQRFSDSPKSAKLPEKSETDETVLGKSIESQLEVLFHSQPGNSSPDRFSRPVNPLANIIGKETEETESVLSEKNNIETSEAPNEDTLLDVENKSCEDVSECRSLRSRRNSQNGLEQSFALLEAKSTKIRKSSRNKNFEEVTVSCPKSRKSMAVAPNEKFEKILEKEESRLINGKRRETITKKQSSTSSELKKNKTGRVMQKKRRLSESSNISETDSGENILSSSTRVTRSGRTSKLLEDINEIQDDDFEVEETSTKKFKRKLRQNDESTDNIFHARKATRTSKKQEDEGVSLDLNRNDKKESRLVVVNSNNKANITKSAHNKNNSKEHKKRTVEEENATEMYTKKQDKSTIEDKKNLISCNSSNSSIKEIQSASASRTTKRGSAIVVSTPSKTRKRTLSTTASTEQIIQENQDSPSRNKRKQKMKVVFTMMENPQLESVIRLLGGSVVESVDTCTVLITNSLKRSMKLLSAVGLGKPICSVKWIENSKKENQFLDPWDYLLIDQEAETKWNFALRTSLERSLQAKLFEGYTFQLLVTSALDVLKAAIECCGGKIVSRTPKEAEHFIVVASPDQKGKYKRLLKQQPNLIIVEPEAIFDGVLRQEIRFERHLLN